jgi:DNA segregation ATPase FtsK/SpoIIIE-like protein
MTGRDSRGSTAQGPLPDPLFRRRWTAPLSLALAPAAALVAVMVALFAASPAAADHSLRSDPGVTERDSSGQAGPSGALVDEAMPVVEKVQPNKGPAAGGSPVTIHGTSLTGATAVSFGGVEATEFKVVSAFVITAVTPPHSTGNASVTVTTQAGTSSVVPKAIYTFAAPTITAIVPSRGSTSGGVKVTVTGTGFALGGATSFKFGHGLALEVNCSSLTVCTMIVPAAKKKGAVFLSGKSGGKTSKKAPAGQFNYITPAEAKSIEEQEAREAQEAKERQEAQEAKEATERQEAREAQEAKERQEAKEKQEAQEAEARERQEAQEAREATERQEAREAQEAKERQEAKEKREAQEAEARERQEAKEAQERQEAKEAQERQEAKEAQERQEAKEAQERQEAKETQEAKERQEAQEAKEGEEAEEKAEREAKEREESEESSIASLYDGDYALNIAGHAFLWGDLSIAA